MADENKADVKKAAQGNEAVQEVVDKDTERGFRGAETDVDPTPNENYTVQGVVKGLPTPETDHDQAVEASGSTVTKFNNKGQI